MQNKLPQSSTDRKVIKKTLTKEIITPTTGKPLREDSPKGGSNYKEIQRLRSENKKLTSEVQNLQEELIKKEEFSQVLSTFAEEKYDSRRLCMYKAKVIKQERLVTAIQIFLMQSALDSQRALFFEMENILGGISKALSGNQPDQSVIVISSIVKSSRKILKDAEMSSKIAYAQLLSSTKVSDRIEIDKASFPDWKSSIKLSGKDILELEISLSDLLACILAQNQSGLAGKIRDCSTKLLNLGIQLPLNMENKKDMALDSDARKLIMNNIKSSVKDQVKDVLSKLFTEKKNGNVEKNLILKELESKTVDISMLDQSIQELKKDIQDKTDKIKSMFEANLLKPFDDIWTVYENSDQQSLLQFYSVFKLHANKIKSFIKFLLDFQF